ncbi:MAG: hypothetical protein BWY91_00679 [bacterium ADurb.BinA028]|nr:MAG: hypothetical protein BWY91_00679 [bacterium ADurb.BinA028]
MEICLLPHLAVVQLVYIAMLKAAENLVNAEIKQLALHAYDPCLHKVRRRCGCRLSRAELLTEKRLRNSFDQDLIELSISEDCGFGLQFHLYQKYRLSNLIQIARHGFEYSTFAD